MGVEVNSTPTKNTHLSLKTTLKREKKLKWGFYEKCYIWYIGLEPKGW